MALEFKVWTKYIWSSFGDNNFRQFWSFYVLAYCTIIVNYMLLLSLCGQFQSCYASHLSCVVTGLKLSHL